ncbi:hypothetical protein [Halomonas salipaludis]|uniref:hypothetical protein n=1 Tax=Halomonas salipaludis TaxID=2032625 RepID=UPI0026C8D896|nr:hypothetical protein [Halomonas salipaludis]
MKTPRLGERLVALIGVALVLFSPPLILVADRPATNGLSWLPLYLFIAWALVITLAAWLLEHRHEPGGRSDDATQQHQSDAPPAEPPRGSQ